MFIMPKPEREEWSEGIKAISYFISGSAIAALGLLIWPITNWRFWVWVALFTLVLANERAIIEGRKVDP